MEGNLAVELADRADAWWDRPLFHVAGRVYGHGEVHRLGERAAGVLFAAGVRAGHRVLVAVPDGALFAVAFLGAVRLGAVAVLSGPELTAAEHRHVLADAAPDVVVCGPELAHRFAGRLVLAPGDLTDEPLRVPPPVHGGRPAFVVYTSGTTGPPKGVLHGHGDVAAMVAAPAAMVDPRPDDVVLSLVRAGYPVGLVASVLLPMVHGCSSVLWTEPARPPYPAEQLRGHRPTLLFGVPTHYAGLVEEDGDAFVSLRAAVSTGEPLLPDLAARAGRILGCPLLDGLGSAEVAPLFVANTLERHRPGTLGAVLAPYEIEVRVPDAGLAAPGEPGILHVRGPSMMSGYLSEPAAALSPDGWLLTGDVVHVDADGFVHHHGRDRDRVTVLGERVLPLAVERALSGHPAVLEVAVLPDDDGDLRAFTVLGSGTVPDRATEDELIGFARQRLTAFEVPRSVLFVTEMPRTPTGKIRRTALAGTSGGI